jgi:hypothetical protein
MAIFLSENAGIWYLKEMKLTGILWLLPLFQCQKKSGDIKGWIRRCKSNDKQYNCQMKWTDRQAKWSRKQFTDKTILNLIKAWGGLKRFFYYTRDHMNQFSKNMVPNFYMPFITIFFWKYQWGNQRPSIKDEQGNVIAKGNQEKDIQSSTRHCTQKI